MAVTASVRCFRFARPPRKVGRVITASPRVMGALGVTFLLAGCSGAEEQPSSSKSSATAAATARPERGKTSCTSVRYVGDSISVGMVSKRQIPDANERLEARFKAVGVRTVSVDASGGRATFETFENRPSTLQALPTSSKGYTGCYVMAVGTNDAGNMAVGSPMDARRRIDAVMAVTGSNRVLWPLLVTDLHSGPYAESGMVKFNDALKAATKRYPNLRLYDWPAERNPAWMEGDEIHDRRIGSRSRALMYAKALTVAFPAGQGPSGERVVGSVPGRPAGAGNRVKLRSVNGDGMAFWAGDTATLAHYTSGPAMR